MAGFPTVRLIMLVGGAATLAAQAAAPGEMDPLPDAGASLLRVMGALALVFALFFGGIWLFRNWPRFASSAGRTGKLRVLESRVLSQRQALYVVGYEKERLLVAVSPNAVSLLTRLPDATETTPDPPLPASVSFAQALRQIITPKP